MLYRGKHVFINGESFGVGKADKATLELLANHRRLDGEFRQPPRTTCWKRCTPGTRTAGSNSANFIWEAIWTDWSFPSPRGRNFSSTGQLPAGARQTLQMFDPDYASGTGQQRHRRQLRRFLQGGGRLQLVAHDGRQ
jgi:hypothetical protein